MDAEAQALADRYYPHVPTALLAHLHRLGEPFPPMDAPRATIGYEHVIAVHPNAEGHEILDGAYLQFSCLRCKVLVFEPNTDRGIKDIYRVAVFHHVRDTTGCCDERLAAFEADGIVSCWPDSLDE